MSLLSKLFGRGTGDTMKPPAPLGRDQFADHYVAMLAEKAPDLTVERADTGIVSAPKYRFKVLTARSGCASARSSGRSAPRWASRSSTARYRRIMSTCSSRCRPILPSATSCAGQRAARHAKSSVGQGGMPTRSSPLNAHSAFSRPCSAPSATSFFLRNHRAHSQLWL